MSIYDEKSKHSIYKWRIANKEQYNAYMNEANKNYYQRNKAMCNLKRVQNARFHKECVRLCGILL